MVRNAACPDSEVGLSALVLKHGLEALRPGTGDLRQIVIDASFTSPTLDEMLAASFAKRLLQGQALPTGAMAFAAYATAVRQGLNASPGMPFEESTQGIFLAMRNAPGSGEHGGDLTVPTVAKRFEDDWVRLQARIFAAAAENKNPASDLLYAGHAEFTRERAFLSADQKTYRVDVQRGQRWLLRLPGGPRRSSGLYLEQPRSLLFPNWSRQDREAPEGGLYLFLAVNWGKGVWVFSTDPVQQLRIGPLADLLHKAEHRRALKLGRDPNELAKDPWYNGSRPEHAGTIVAAPRAGTALSDGEVLRIVKRWAKARRWIGRNSALKWLAVAAAAVVVAIVVGFSMRPGHVPSGSSSAEVGTATNDGKDLGLRLTWHSDRRTKFRVDLSINEPWPIEARKNDQELTFRPKPLQEPFASDHVAKLRIVLKSTDRSVPWDEASKLDVQVKVNDADKIHAARIHSDPEKRELTYLASPLSFSKDNTIVLSVDNPADAHGEFQLEASWVPMRTLHVLAVGVSDYDHLTSLQSPRKDAQETAAVFRAQGTTLFDNVRVKSVVDKNGTTRAGIFDALQWLRDGNCQPFDMVVILCSGHGINNRAGHFFFAPSDYVAENPGKFGLSGFELVREAGELPCDVLVVIDSCCSGRANEGWGKLTVRPGMLMIPAALPDTAAQGNKWDGYSALTLSFIEGISGKYLAEPGKGSTVYETRLADGVISLEDLRGHIRKRMRELIGNTDLPEPIFDSSTPLKDIAIAPAP